MAYGGWATTLVDSLDTLLILGLMQEFKDATKASTSLDFAWSHEAEISTFGTNIRYLGAFLAAYDLSGDHALLYKAIEVGELLLAAFDTPSHLPVAKFRWQEAASGAIQNTSFTTIAELGSYSLEFTHLSQVTGDMPYQECGRKILMLVALSTEMPSSSCSLGGCSDSAYEYLLKTHQLVGGAVSTYEEMYRAATDAIVEHLLFQPATPDNESILALGTSVAATGTRPVLDPKLEHLSCFAGGMFALGSRLLDVPEHLSIAEKLANGCIWAYNAFPLGVMPETSYLMICDRQPCVWEDHDQNSFRLLPPGILAVTDPAYRLRPEAIESLFYLYRITGNTALQDVAWEMFQQISRLTRTEFGNAELADVTVTFGMPRKVDSMSRYVDILSLTSILTELDSYWMAETLKYFYLIFSEPSLGNLDEWVYSTEGHLFRLKCRQHPGAVDRYMQTFQMRAGHQSPFSVAALDF
ncbi:uncharacterized protein HMPREF1541_06271 [Cyphellophora europaea CBS 101466]|uniref:alpha-1,2-Mannosidase n=1 Tax=Cyphellophora europaea (strain CBS 101466) TaxID=1220924 RepID=W2RPI6_CYPE1|nr:uncharacterized protein HMPREF1541_06271 [Cyphellophora europaea CBS 101466]ETN38240.1 hypothetical protein HMPREF1541_06271 [Cyphellophora europaea CBS 101466]